MESRPRSGNRIIWVAALFLCLPILLLLYGCGPAPDSETEADSDNTADSDSGSAERETVIGPGPVIDRSREGLTASIVYIKEDDTLWEYDAGSTDRDAWQLTALPEGYSLAGGPVCSTDGEKIFTVLRDDNNIPWIACYHVNQDVWEINAIPEATDWPDWTDGFLTAPNRPLATWWRGIQYAAEAHRAIELFITDLETVQTYKIAVFLEEPLFPLGWSHDGEYLVCQAPRGLLSFHHTYFYLLQPGSNTRQIAFLPGSLHETWLELVEVDFDDAGEQEDRDDRQAENAYIEWFYVGWNPYRPMEIWLNEVHLDYNNPDSTNKTVYLKRLSRGGNSYEDLPLRVDPDRYWKVEWHPTKPAFIAFANQLYYPTPLNDLHLINLEPYVKLCLVSEIQGACWRGGLLQ